MLRFHVMVTNSVPEGRPVEGMVVHERARKRKWAGLTRWAYLARGWDDRARKRPPGDWCPLVAFKRAMRFELMTFTLAT